MFNLDVITNSNNVKHNLKWPYNLDHPYRILIIVGSGSGKTNALLNLIKERDNDELIDKIYLYAKDLNEQKYQLLIKKREEAGMVLNEPNPEAFIEYSNTMDGAYNNINNYNSTRRRKALIVFDDMIADINTNKKFQAIIKELFFRCRKMNIYLVSVSSILFFCSKRS